MAARTLTVHAPAKINLSLRVVGVRAGGYHELRTIFQSIALHDTLTIRARGGPFRLECDDPACPADSTNLVWRAVEQMWAATGRRGAVSGLTVRLTKRIPAQAGLGGGSSDGAAAIRAVGALLRVSPARQRAVAASLGADVPFFLDPHPSRVTGVGERIAPLQAMPQLPLVIAIPPFEVATAAVFRALDPDSWSGPAPDSDIDAILRGEITPAITVNDLAPIAIGQFREIGRLKGLLQDLGARAAQMSGSGGAVFGVFHTLEEAERAAANLQRRAPFATVVSATTLSSETSGESPAT